MGYDTFISYSTRNAREAGLLHRALTDAGLTAFLATEQLQAGAGWAGELVEAIRTSKTMLLLFSRHSNDSPQVLREVQAAVKYRVPLIPVRIDGSEPTRDMEYFLGTTHWHDATEPPFEDRVGDVIERTRDVLKGERNVWRLVQRRTGNRTGLIIGGTGVALLLLWSLTRSPTLAVGSLPDPLQDLRGAWKLESGPQSAPGDCWVTIAGYVWSGSGKCPAAWQGGGSFQGGEGSAGGPGGANAGDGWYNAQRGNANVTGSWERGTFGSLTLSEANGGVWRFSAADEDDVPDISREILERSGHDWPLADLPGIAQRAIVVARREWRADAELTAINLRSGGLGGGISTSVGDYSITFEFVSAAARRRVELKPYYGFGVLGKESIVERGRIYAALPEKFQDLPDALRDAASRDHVTEPIELLELRNWWRTTYGSVRLDGLLWFMRPAQGDQYAVSGAAR